MMLAAYLSNEAQSLLKGLLQKEAPKRLGYGANGSEDVMQHSFFRCDLAQGDLTADTCQSCPLTAAVSHAATIMAHSSDADIRDISHIAAARQIHCHQCFSLSNAAHSSHIR